MDEERHRETCRAASEQVAYWQSGKRRHCARQCCEPELFVLVLEGVGSCTSAAPHPVPLGPLVSVTLVKRNEAYLATSDHVPPAFLQSGCLAVLCHADVTGWLGGEQRAPGRRAGNRLVSQEGRTKRRPESQLLPGNNFTTECNIPGNFMCGNGLCIPGNWQCDGVPDCFDKSDEKGCSKVRSKCAPTFFACASGLHCIIGRFRCNGFRDCPDGSDEDNCTLHGSTNIREWTLSISRRTTAP
ncbi:hypothetical protein P4O66_015799 [Electrophorus voltai]|uniref:Low-density lipoprotein receptor class A domain-containing protein 3 n=1 Tax=Electrophorus voltai TaxID=2609070 RepID=A0AAD8YZR3_9TELE|nr:hypothetical protein P4O66_015799 [Electrophorus voltai]